MKAEEHKRIVEEKFKKYKEKKMETIILKEKDTNIEEQNPEIAEIFVQEN